MMKICLQSQSTIIRLPRSNTAVARSAPGYRIYNMIWINPKLLYETSPIKMHPSFFYVPYDPIKTNIYKGETKKWVKI